MQVTSTLGYPTKKCHLIFLVIASGAPIWMAVRTEGYICFRNLPLKCKGKKRCVLTKKLDSKQDITKFSIDVVNSNHIYEIRDSCLEKHFLKVEDDNIIFNYNNVTHESSRKHFCLGKETRSRSTYMHLQKQILRTVSVKESRTTVQKWEMRNNPTKQPKRQSPFAL